MDNHDQSHCDDPNATSGSGCRSCGRRRVTRRDALKITAAAAGGVLAGTAGPDLLLPRSVAAQEASPTPIPEVQIPTGDEIEGFSPLLTDEPVDIEYWWGNQYRENTVAGKLSALVNEANNPNLSRTCGFAMMPKPEDRSLAWLVVVCEQGPELSVLKSNTRTKRAHIVRQLVEVHP